MLICVIPIHGANLSSITCGQGSVTFSIILVLLPKISAVMLE